MVYLCSYKVPLPPAPSSSPSLSPPSRSVETCEAGHCRESRPSSPSHTPPMQGLRRPGAGRMGLVVVVMVVLAAVTSAVSEPVCNVKDLYPCLATAKGAYPPEPDQKCCSIVMEANPSCLCSEFMNTKMPDTFIKNVLAIPKACGRYQLSGTKCGSYTIE